MDTTIMIAVALFSLSVILLIGAVVFFTLARRHTRALKDEENPAEGRKYEKNRGERGIVVSPTYAATTPSQTPRIGSHRGRLLGAGARTVERTPVQPATGGLTVDTPDWDPVYHGEPSANPANPESPESGASNPYLEYTEVYHAVNQKTPESRKPPPMLDIDYYGHHEPTYELAGDIHNNGVNQPPQRAPSHRGLRLPDHHPSVKISWVDEELASDAGGDQPPESPSGVDHSSAAPVSMPLSDRLVAVGTHGAAAAAHTTAQRDMVVRLEANEKFDDGIFEMTDAAHFSKFAPGTERDQAFGRVGTALQHNLHVTKVRMVNVGGTDALAEAIAGALRVNTRICEVNLETNNIGGAGVAALAAAVSRSTSLEKIRLANQQHPAPTDALADLISAVETNGVTTTCNVDLRDRVMQLGLDAALQKNLETAHGARVAKEQQTGKFKVALSPLQKQLEGLATSGETELDLSDSICFKGMSDSWQTTRFADCVAHSPTLTTLKLEGLGLKDVFALTFASVALRGCDTLEELLLNRNAISATGIIAIAQALDNTRVRVIKVNNQSASCSTIAEVAVVQAAQVCKTLTSFSIPWRNKQNQDAFDKQARYNADRVRAAKAASRGITYVANTVLAPTKQMHKGEQLPHGVPQGAVAVLW